MIEKGKVELLDTQEKLTHVKTLGTNEILGHLAFLTGSPHQNQAIVWEDRQPSVFISIFGGCRFHMIAFLLVVREITVPN